MRPSLLAVATVTAVSAIAVAIWYWPTSEPYGKVHRGDKLPAAVRRKATSTLYCNGLAMDIYRAEGAHRRAPAVLYAHPGSWVLGDKSSGSYLDQLVPALTKRGFVVAAFNYRLGIPWPAQVQDAACAVRFLRAHHATYGIDPGHIGAWGGSAGAQLMSLVGTMDRSGFDVGPYLDQSSRLQAVVDMYGPADIPAFVERIGRSNHDIQAIWGPVMTSDPTGLRKASPGYWASKDDPPFLILQGDQDSVVPLGDSVAFARRLRAAGVSAKLVIVRRAGHGLSDRGQDPTRNDLLGLTIHFFQQHLMSQADRAALGQPT